MADTNTLVEQLSGLTVLEVADLVKQLEEKWGVSAAAPVAAAAAGGGGGAAAAAPAEAQTQFDVILKEAGANKIGDNKEGVTKEEAEAISSEIDAAGAKGEIKWSPFFRRQAKPESASVGPIVPA